MKQKDIKYSRATNRGESGKGGVTPELATIGTIEPVIPARQRVVVLINLCERIRNIQARMFVAIARANEATARVADIYDDIDPDQPKDPKDTLIPKQMTMATR
jgi:hypothetical protein